MIVAVIQSCRCTDGRLRGTTHIMEITPLLGQFQRSRMLLGEGWEGRGQTDRQTDRDGHRQKERDSNSGRQSDRQRAMDRQIDSQLVSQLVRQTDCE